MPLHARKRRGFTLVEIALTLSIIGVVAALAWSSLARSRPRAQLANAANELQALIHAARQQALATGHQVAVLVFPAQAVAGNGVGRIVVYEDGDGTFLSSAAALNLDNYDPGKPTATAASNVVTTFDFALPVVIGPATGMGETAKLLAPWSDVTVDTDCSFCSSDSHRGAIVFDERGRARFYSAAGPALDVGSGGSFSITAEPAVPGQRTLVIGGAAGAIQVINNG